MIKALIQYREGFHYPKLKGWLQSRKIAASCRFAEIHIPNQAKYQLDDEDQCDWNKVFGRVGYKIVNWRLVRVEQFVVWRYCKGRKQVAKYFREGQRFWWEDKLQDDGTGAFFVNLGFLKSFLAVGGYFGGSDDSGNGIGGVAPKDLSIRAVGYC